jgi:uncharacterized protein with von Willebrand factor type A (vWA) domain
MQGAAIVRHVVTFGRVLREVGIEVGPGRVEDAVRGLGAVDLTRQDDVYFTLRQTLVSRHDELELFDRAFVAWFLRGPVAPLVRQKQMRRFTDRVARDTLETGTDDADDADPSSTPHELGASGHELLREKDFAEMTPEEFERVRKLMAAIARTRPRRQSRRRTPDTRGDRLDLRRLCRKSLRSGGEPIEQPWKSRKVVPRKLVVLCDISGSMDAYARALLFYLHAIVGSGGGVEAFAFGTRLTRLTPDLATRDPEAALAAATRSPWTGGAARGSGARSPSSTRPTADARSRAARSSSSCRTGGNGTIRTSCRARWRSSRGPRTPSFGSTR